MHLPVALTRGVAAWVAAVGVAAGAEAPAVSELPVAQRIADRTFPAVFQAWNPADNLAEPADATAARHDLIFHGARFFGLQWNDPHEGLATGFTPASVVAGQARRRALLARNPHLVLLLEVRYRDAHRSFLPEGHAWWRRDVTGRIVPGWEEGGYLQLDFGNPDYRAQVARQAGAAVASGVVDGVMLDWWADDADRLALAQAVRRAIGEPGLLLANANDRTTPLTAPLLNGYFMECTRSATPADWRRIAATLVWAEAKLRAPRINCVETWYHRSRADEALMRATTALTLVYSNGYCLFSDPNPLPTPDHLHNWYAFWDRGLGRPLGPGAVRPDGLVTREFGGGTVVYNPAGNAAGTLTFDEPRTSRATGRRALAHPVAAGDGDLLLRDPPAPAP